MCPRGGLMPRGCVCVKFALGGGVSVTPGGTQTHPGGPRANLGRRNPPQGVPPSPWGGVGVPPIHLGAGGGTPQICPGGGSALPQVVQCYPGGPQATPRREDPPQGRVSSAPRGVPNY